MLKFLGLLAAILVVWHAIDHEWIQAAAWAFALACAVVVVLWLRSARSAWRG